MRAARLMDASLCHIKQTKIRCGPCVRATAIAGDIYWEDEDDSLNEFLEVKEPDSGLISHLRRLKRQLVSTLTDTTEDPVEYESATSDENGNDVDDDETPIEGSGTLRRDPDNREKTLRVTFVVMEPFQNEYSDRDSEQFQNISIGLADAVNNLFDTVPGTQRASLVRIQSRLSDEFSCKVTMDIITSGFDDTKELARILQDHIRQRRQLGIFTVDENEFLSTDIVDPGTTNLECAADEVKCDDNHCIAGWAWCNGSPDCPDGSDEVSCPDQDSEGEDQINEVDQQTSTPKSDNDDLDTFSVAPNEDNELIPETTTPRTERGDGDEGDDITSSDTENEVIPETTTAQIDSCAAYEFRCDNTRCVHRRRQCDRQQDCDDGSDEADCPPGKGSSRQLQAGAGTGTWAGVGRSRTHSTWLPSHAETPRHSDRDIITRASLAPDLCDRLYRLTYDSPTSLRIYIMNAY
ncbi:SCO-spondin [Papilio xuthus]|uniref:SCO-spondin n=1 Tax=Papilio xuthus TaxID=66420 RepID=A0A194PG74_PAPXU|nr:SCO-spondin [Papilio xuthus]